MTDIVPFQQGHALSIQIWLDGFWFILLWTYKLRSTNHGQRWNLSSLHLEGPLSPIQPQLFRFFDRNLTASYSTTQPYRCYDYEMSFLAWRKVLVSGRWERLGTTSPGVFSLIFIWFNFLLSHHSHWVWFIYVYAFISFSYFFFSFCCVIWKYLVAFLPIFEKTRWLALSFSIFLPVYLSFFLFLLLYVTFPSLLLFIYLFFYSFCF
jgi:hypothetical protein